MNAMLFEKAAQETIDFQSNVLKGIKTLINMPKDDIKSDTLEKDKVFSIGKMKMYHYKPVKTGSSKVKIPVLVTYALVNKQYMMDIQPDRSVIKAFLEAGLDVYIIDWGYPTAEDRYMSMDDHINWYMDECVDFIRKETNHKKINLLGVCQGGTFSTIYTALHQDKINALVTMVTPVDFSPNDALLFAWSKFLDADALVDAYGVIPGGVMNVSYLMLKPFSLTLDKYISLAVNKQIEDPEFLGNFLRMEKWIFDSPAQAGDTIRQFINDLYKDNKLIKGELELGGRKVDLKNITCPLFAICAEYDHLVPLSSSKPLMDAVGSSDKTFISFPVGHIGMYVSSRSQKEIAPQIGRWLAEKSKK
ncbi:MAG: class III poly(R)-hydroxyalkanoic acid synthase subunit PhaC [Deltaproteobacteria bacterium]|jgi:polyhydroxyalkanoate synthase|nr:class III poly(R)-hydroxyalkanoic acid synthase subunit PhaC [Deltaproteobacteria bacterium]